MKYLNTFFGITFLIIFNSMISPNIITNSDSNKLVNNKKNNEIIENNNDTNKNVLVDEVNNYIKHIAPTSVLNGETIVDLCYTYDVDIIFVLAQGQIESHYGTRGTASKTHSVFNVGAYDGYSASQQKNNGFGFSHPDESVEPYLQLLTTKYLVNGKTEKDLMNSYVNYLGMRYASNGNYEIMLRSVYKNIDKKTNIKNLYNEYIFSLEC